MNVDFYVRVQSGQKRENGVNEKMTEKEFAKRIFAVVLTFMLTISMSGYTFIEAFAEDGELPQNDETEAVADEAEPAAEAQEAVNEEAAPAEQTADTTPDAVVQQETDAEEALAPSEPEAFSTDASNDGETTPETTLPNIEVKAAGDENFITVVWKKVDNAAYYMVFLDDSATGDKVDAGDNIPRKHVFTNVSGGAHKVTVKAFRAKTGEELAAEAAASAPEGTEGSEGSGGNDSTTPAQTEEGVQIAEGSAEDINAVIRAKLGSHGVPAYYTGQSLRPMIGEGNGGYAVAQGAATDGKGYAYYLMASSSTQKGRVLKVRMSDGATVGTGPVIETHHGNGMTYDSARGKLVACGYGSYRHQLTFIDPDSLTITSQEKITYPNTDMEAYKNGYYANGIAAIAYVRLDNDFGVYVARVRGDVNSNAKNDIMVIDAKSLKMIGYIRTKVSADYPETYQSMDADAKYVYFLVSPGGKNKNNVILCLDWNSENLLPVINGEDTCVKNMWYCNNSGSGRPDAVMTIPVAHETEGLFHTTNADGSGHFYVSEYYGRWMYKTVKKKVKVKVKWKKVRKWYNKKTGKWQKKKPKKKYRGKSKKVWKYKTKTKKKKVSVKDYWARDDYVYDLGSF